MALLVTASVCVGSAKSELTQLTTLNDDFKLIEGFVDREAAYVIKALHLQVPRADCCGE